MRAVSDERFMKRTKGSGGRMSREPRIAERGWGARVLAE